MRQDGARLAVSNARSGLAGLADTTSKPLVLFAWHGGQNQIWARTNL